MSPPTEQLIRDYINRLSVAAQGRLSRDDRRALMDRTRGYIEHNTGLSGPATMPEVAAVLSRLGDPSLVVAKEVERLAEIRGHGGAPPPVPLLGRLARTGRREPGRLSASWHWPARPGNPADLRAMLTGGRTAAAGTNAGDVAARDADERDADMRVAGIDGGRADPAGIDTRASASGLEALGLVGSGRDDAGAEGAIGDAEPGSSGQAGAGPLAGQIPAQAGEPASLNGLTSEVTTPGQLAESGTSASQPAAADPHRPSWPHGPAIRRDETVPGRAQQDAQDLPAAATAGTGRLAAARVAGDEATGGPVVAEPAPETGSGADEDAGEGVDSVGGAAAAGDTGELTAVDLSLADVTVGDAAASEASRLVGVRRMSTAVVAWSREKTLESVATILLGVGGVIFPPIWLLGAVVALASKVWDYRDKWVGLAGPILLTVVGTAAGVILAGSQSSLAHDLHVGWLSADIASRISAALGTAYLAWRSVHGRRPAAVPPWNKPHRVG